MNNLCKLIAKNGKIVKIYVAKTTVNDSYTKDVTETFYNPIPVKALVSDYDLAKLEWVIPGLNATRSKVLTMHKNYRPLILLSYKIEIDGESETYLGYKKGRGNNLRIKESGDYIKIIIATV